ncbi:MAG: hypothetical protein JWO38_4533 [Gemmataceae bacterium]|nr:hypothetical protein [Gemmataceae bacterium]
MTKVALLAAALVGALSAAPSRADVEVAPPPREVRPDGSRDPAPAAAEPARPENPAETVDRIIKNSKTVGDKLAMTDAGTETRASQDKILKDIDSLLNPPPQSGGSSNDKNDQKNQDKDKNKDKNDKSSSGKGNSGSKDKSGMPPPAGMPPPEGMGNSKGGPQQANTGGSRPRRGKSGGQPKDPGNDPVGGKKPDEGMAKADPKAGPNPAGGKPSDQTGKMAVKPALPLDDDVVKEVWGHLPDKLRQQVTQYYKEQFMPRYSDLLKQYYSSLANTPQKPGGSR